jgi:hypothetical protein
MASRKQRKRLKAKKLAQKEESGEGNTTKELKTDSSPVGEIAKGKLSSVNNSNAVAKKLANVNIGGSSEKKKGAAAQRRVGKTGRGALVPAAVVSGGGGSKGESKAKAIKEKGGDSEKTCIICSDPIKFVAFGKCDHGMLCSECALRSRILFKSNACPYCKTDLERIVVTPDLQRDWASFSDSIWGKFCGKELQLDEESGAFFHGKKHMKEMQRLRGFSCGVRGCRVMPFKGLKELEAHLWSEHKLKLCKVCVNAPEQRKFMSEHKRFTKQQLDRHMKKGEASEGFEGHPECHFCRTRFYSDDELFQHLHKTHFKCHVCEQGGRSNQYFRDYRHLEEHFRSKHFLCEQNDCLQKRFVAFLTEIEYKGHMAAAHPHIPFDRKIEVNFKVRSVEPNDDSNSSNSIEFGGDEVNSLAFDYNPAGRRVAQEEDNYPSLQESTAASAPQGGRGARWTGNNASLPGVRGNVNSLNDFPTLGGNGHSRSLNANVKSKDDFPSLPTQTRNGRKKQIRARDHLGPKQKPPGRVIAPPSGARALSQTEEALSSGPEWPCRSCTLVNAGWKARCSACGTSKGKVVGKKSNGSKKAYTPAVPAAVASAAPAGARRGGAEGGGDLISMVRSGLNHNEKKFGDFQALCRKYVGRIISPREYYMTIKRMFRPDALRAFFPLLVATLPSTDLQAPLEQLFSASVGENSRGQGDRKVSAPERAPGLSRQAPPSAPAIPPRVFQPPVPQPLSRPSSTIGWNGGKIVARGRARNGQTNSKITTGQRSQQLKRNDVPVPKSSGKVAWKQSSAGSKGNKKPKKKKNKKSKELQDMAFVRY